MSDHKCNITATATATATYIQDDKPSVLFRKEGQPQPEFPSSLFHGWRDFSEKDRMYILMNPMTAIQTELNPVGGSNTLFKGGSCKLFGVAENTLVIAILHVVERRHRLEVRLYGDVEYPTGKGAWKQHRAIDRFVEGEYKKWKER